MLVDRFGRQFSEGATPHMGQVAYALDRLHHGELDLFDERKIVRSKGIAYLRGMDVENALIYGLFRARRGSLLGRGWELNPGGDSAHDVRSAEIVEAALNRMSGTFETDLAEILDAVKYGWALLEIVWERWSDPVLGKLVVPKALVALKIENFRFQVDTFGNVTGLKQVYPKQQPLTVGKFIVATYRGAPGDPHGSSLYARLYWPDWFMRNGWAFWARALERFGSPVVTITHPRWAGQPTRTKAEELLGEIQHSTGVVMDEDLKLEFLEATMRGAVGFKDFIDHQKEIIQIGIIGQTLTSSQGKVGSQSLGTVHQEEKEQIVDEDAEWLQTVVNEQLVARIAAINSPGAATPEFRFVERETEDLDTLADRYVKLANAGVDIPAEHVRKRFGIPLAEDGEDLLRGTAPAPPPPGDEGGGEGEHAGPGNPADSFSISQGDLRFSEEVEPFWREFTEYENPSSMREIERVSREMLESIRPEARTIWEAIRDDLVKQVGKSGALDSGDLTAELKPKTRDWKELVERTWLMSHLNGRASGLGELARHGIQFGEGVTFAERLRTDVPALDEAGEWFAGREAMTDAEFGRLGKEARNQAWYITTRESTEAVAQVQDALKQSLDNGWGLRGFRRDVERRFRVWTGNVFGAAAPRSIAQADARLATVFRTNIMSALNRGRDAVFAKAEGSSLPDPIVAYQYSAIMDGRTRATHAAMDSLIYATDDPIWQRWTPPAGYNCRCTRVPVLASQAAKMSADTLSVAAPVIKGEMIEPDKDFGKMAFCEGAPVFVMPYLPGFDVQLAA